MPQKDKKYTEGISKHLNYALINLNLVGGNMHPEELQDKEKVINSSRSDEYNAVTMEDKLVGGLIINSACDKKYGGLKRLLIHSMNQGQNRYPNSKAATYTMLCKYLPECTKNKNESMAMCYRPATGVSL